MPGLVALTAKDQQHLGTQDTAITLHKVKGISSCERSFYMQETWILWNSLFTYSTLLK